VKVAGVLLAGGLSRRMGGGDKSLRSIAGETILARVIARARPQVEALCLNANGDPARFAEFDLPVVPDSIEGFAGPLAGVLAGLDWAADSVPGCTHVASFATDAPFLPEDLVAGLARAVEREGADMACAASGGREHPVFGLWPLRLREALRRALAEEGLRKVDVWTGRYRRAVAHWPDRPLDPFFNANEPDDLARAERLLAAPTVYRDAMTVGIVVERRRLANPWQDESWLPVAVLPGVPPQPPGSVLVEEPGATRYYAGALPIELFRKETFSYKINLETGAPRVYVVLRRDDAGKLPWRPLLATVAPDEAQAAMEGGEDIVEGVPMPATVLEWVEAFVAALHVEEPFHKRKRK
jgi:molybdopterin-guanine dinucleotide biosynthesis protein A